MTLGAAWLLDGALQLQPFMFTQGFVSQVLAPSADGQPAIVADLIRAGVHLFALQPAVFNAAAAALQIGIGIALMSRRALKLGLTLSIAWALAVWCFGEGFGGLLTGTASPLDGAPGAALLYIVASLILWPKGRSPLRTVASGSVIGENGGRFVWAALWCLLAALWLTSAHDAPDWFAMTQAILCGAVGLGVLLDWLTRPLLAVGALVAIGYWIVGQDLGGMFSGQATDPNSGPLVLLLAASLFPVGLRPSRTRPWI